MPIFQTQPKLLNAKLTALWAVSESGLGGMLHAVKIPFSGLFLGSFAIIIITYIAHSNQNQRFSAILKATLLVIVIKAMVSPHSPPMAYVAVLFQGLLGALIYGGFGVNKLTAISFGAIALLESGFQKVLTLTILFGMGLWESILKFFEGLQNQLQAEWMANLPWLFLTLYGLLYLTIGVVAGNMAFKLPVSVFENAKRLKEVHITNNIKDNPKKRSKRKRLWLIGGLLIFAISVFVISGMHNRALYVILRTLGAVIFFLFVFNPLFKYLLQKWVDNKKSKDQKRLNTILELMPTIKNNVGLAQQLAISEKGLWRRTKLFLMNWLSLSLYFTEEDV